MTHFRSWALQFWEEHALDEMRVPVFSIHCSYDSQAEQTTYRQIKFESLVPWRYLSLKYREWGSASAIFVILWEKQRRRTYRKLISQDIALSGMKWRDWNRATNAMIHHTTVFVSLLPGLEDYQAAVKGDAEVAEYLLQYLHHFPSSIEAPDLKNNQPHIVLF